MQMKTAMPRLSQQLHILFETAKFKKQGEVWKRFYSCDRGKNKAIKQMKSKSIYIVQM